MISSAYKLGRGLAAAKERGLPCAEMGPRLPSGALLADGPRCFQCSIGFYEAPPRSYAGLSFRRLAYILLGIELSTALRRLRWRCTGK